MDGSSQTDLDRHHLNSEPWSLLTVALLGVALTLMIITTVVGLVAKMGRRRRNGNGSGGTIMGGVGGGGNGNMMHNGAMRKGGGGDGNGQERGDKDNFEIISKSIKTVAPKIRLYPVPSRPKTR